MLATSIHVDAGIEGNIRAIVVTDDGLGEVAQEPGPGRGIFAWIPICIPLQSDLLKPIGRVAPGTPAPRCWCLFRHETTIAAIELFASSKPRTVEAESIEKPSVPLTCSPAKSYAS